MRASSKLLERLEMLRQLLMFRDQDGLHRLLKLDVDQTIDGEPRDYRSPDADLEWRKLAEELAARAETDDEALFELVERDPRFLSSELVIARIVEWRIRVVLSRYKRRATSSSSESPAQGKLNRIARAIASAGRSGSHGHISMNDLVDAEDSVRASVTDAVALINDGCTDEVEIAQKVGLAEFAAELRGLVAKPTAPEAVVGQILIAWFDTKSIEEYRARAHRLAISPRE